MVREAGYSTAVTTQFGVNDVGTDAHRLRRNMAYRSLREVLSFAGSMGCEMRILLSSHFFHPSVGGIEQVSLALATQFALAGHTVKVVTTTPQSDGSNFQFEVVRRPSVRRLLELVRWSEVVFHNNISLRTWWPLIFIRRPWVIAHHTWIARTDSSLALRDRLKHFLTRFAVNIAVSQPIAGHLTVPSIVIGNPYRDELFKRDRLATRDIDLIFVGRLVPDKGVDILISALERLRERNFFLT